MVACAKVDGHQRLGLSKFELVSVGRHSTTLCMEPAILHLLATVTTRWQLWYYPYSGTSMAEWCKLETLHGRIVLASVHMPLPTACAIDVWMAAETLGLIRELRLRKVL